MIVGRLAIDGFSFCQKIQTVDQLEPEFYDCDGFVELTPFLSL